MQARVREAGGTFELATAPGTGRGSARAARAASAAPGEVTA